MGMPLLELGLAGLPLLKARPILWLLPVSRVGTVKCQPTDNLRTGLAPCVELTGQDLALGSPGICPTLSQNACSEVC